MHIQPHVSKLASTGADRRLARWLPILTFVTLGLTGCFDDDTGSGSTDNIGDPAMYTVTATAGEGGAISPKSASVNRGETTSFTVTSDTGYSIESISGCGGSLSNHVYTTGAITGDCSITARFTQAPPAVMHAIDVTALPAEGGTVSGSGTYGDGAEVTVTATASAGYDFINWTVAGAEVSTSASYSFNAAGERDLVANFAASGGSGVPAYMVNAIAGEGGAVSPESVSVDQGEMASFTVIPNTGYSLAEVSGCGGTLSGNTYTTGGITEACEVTASFALNTYTVSTSAGTGGTISATEQSVAHGSTATFTVTPEAGYHIDGVSGCNGTLNGDTYTTGMVTEACEVKASFAINTYTVSAMAGLGGNLSPAEQRVEHGSTATFTVSAEAGYGLLNMSGCGGTLSGGTYTTGEITEACEVTASFVVTLGAPQAVRAIAGGGRITVSWSAVSDAESYALYWGESSDIDPDVFGSYQESQSGILATDYTLTGLENGSTYYVVVTARAGSAEGPGSAEVSAMPVAPRFAYVVNNRDDSVSTYVADSETGRLKWIGKAAAGVEPYSVTVHPMGQYAYVTNDDSNSISQYTIGSDGRLSPMTTASVATGARPTSVVMDPSGQYAYVANFGANSLSQYTIGSDGGLAPMTPPTVSAGTGAFFITIDPTGKYVFVANVNGDNVSQFTIESDGSLSAMDSATVAVGADPISVTVDPSGQYAYVVNRNSDSISQFIISADGSLTPMATATVATGLEPFSIGIDPAGQFAYVANWGSGDVSQYTIESDGSLSPMPVATVAAGSNPRFVSVDPSGQFVYVANYNGDSVSQFTVGADGSLAPMAPASVAGYSGAITMAITGGVEVKTVPRFAYVANAGSQNVSQYTIDTNGGFVPMSPATVAVVASWGEPDSITVDPSGKYAYAADWVFVLQYTVGSDGRLSPMADATVQAGNSPIDVTVHPSGRYVYVVNNVSDDVSQFTVGSDGSLSAMTPASVAAGTGPESISVDPSGRYVYVGNRGSDNVSQYSVGADGRLSPMTPATVAAGNSPTSVAVDPTGRYAYVTNYTAGSAAVSQYAIAGDGSLSPMTPATVAAGVYPTAVTVDPSGQYAYVANSWFGDISQFAIASDGRLSSLAAEAVATGDFPTSITVDPSGRYVYAANSAFNGNTVSQYSIEPDGSLSSINPATVTAGSAPSSVVTVGAYQ